MSKDTVRQMFERIEKDAVLKGKYAELMKAHQKEIDGSLAGRLVDLGKGSGFAFSPEDLFAARAEIIDRANSNAELSAGDLGKVAGGGISNKEFGTVLSVLTVGIGCAVSSVLLAIHSNRCAELLSTSDPETCRREN